MSADHLPWVRLAMAGSIAGAVGCQRPPLPWPASPLYDTPDPVAADSLTRAISPPPAVVSLQEEAGRWVVRRPATPSLIGIQGDPSRPIPRDRKHGVFDDQDGDGKPGVTVRISVGRHIEGEVYLVRREVFENQVTLMEDGSLRGSVTDRSEQLVVGASSRLFDSDAAPRQVADPGLNPLLLLPIPASLDDCDALMAQAGELFPPVPEFAERASTPRATSTAQ